MLKKFLTCFSLMFVLIFAAATAQARPAELLGINAFDVDRNTVRIEISFDRGKLDLSDVATEIRSGILFVDLNNALPGRVSRVSGTQVQPGAQSTVEKIVANKMQDKHMRIQIHLAKEMSEGDVKISVEPANRSEKKSARIIIDVPRNFVPSDRKFSKNGYIFDDAYNYDFNGDGLIVVIDPGHGGSDSGARGPSGLKEKDVALAVSLKAERFLAESGYNVVMTRRTDIDVAAPGVSDGVELQARVDKAPPNAALFISVHCNAFSNSTSHGMETFYAPGAVEGQRLARLLNEELERFGGLHNRGVKSARFYVMTHSRCPASLIELGFITNPYEENLLADEDYQQRLARAITNAVNRYFDQGGSNQP